MTLSRKNSVYFLPKTKEQKQTSCRQHYAHKCRAWYQQYATVKEKQNSGCKCQWTGGPVLRWNQDALTFCTLCTDPSWWTAAQTVVATTLAPVHTLAMLTAVHAVRTNRAGNGAVFACPTRQTLTGTWTTTSAQSKKHLTIKAQNQCKTPETTGCSYSCNSVY